MLNRGNNFLKIPDIYSMVSRCFLIAFFILCSIQSKAKTLFLEENISTYQINDYLKKFNKKFNESNVEELDDNLSSDIYNKKLNSVFYRESQVYWVSLTLKSYMYDGSFVIFDEGLNKLLPVFYKRRDVWKKNILEPFSPEYGAEITVYFKTNISSFSIRNLKLENSKTFLKKRWIYKYLIGLLFGIYISLIIFNFIFILVRKSQTYFSLIGYLYSLALYFIFSKYFFLDLFSIQQNYTLQLVHFASLSLNMIFSLIFLFELFDINKKSKEFKIILIIGTPIVFLNIISIFLNEYSMMISLISYKMLCLVFFIFGISKIKKNTEKTQIFTLSYFIILIGSTTLLMRTFRLLESNFIFDYAIFISQVLSGFLLSISNFLNVTEIVNNENKKKIESVNNKIELEKINNEKLKNEVNKEKIENKNYNKEIFYKNSEIISLLEVSGLSFLSVNDSGKICQPISSHCQNIFKTEIEGEKLSNIVFPNLKPGMKDFEELKNNLIKIFGADKEFFDNIKIRFPRKSLITSGDESKKVILRVSYEPIFGVDKKIYKILCLIEDKTTETDEYFTIRSESLRYSFLTEVFNMPNNHRIEIAKKLEEPVKNLYQLLNYLSNSSIESENPLIVSRTVKYLLSYSKKEFSAESLEKQIEYYKSDINIQIDFFENFGKENGYVSISSVLGIYDLIVNLLADTLQFSEELGRFDVGLKLDKGIDEEIETTLEVLEAQFSNLMEYTLVIRNKDVESVTNSDLKQAALNAKTNSRKNFETNIPLIYQKAKKLSLLYFVQGEHFKFSVFEDLAESVRLLPKADVISASDLRHNLFEPYLETIKLKDDFF